MALNALLVSFFGFFVDDCPPDPRPLGERPRDTPSMSGRWWWSPSKLCFAVPGTSTGDWAGDGRVAATWDYKIRHFTRIECLPPTTMTNYRRLQWYAIAISVASVIYNGFEGGISIAFGADSSSHSLVFFGIQSGIEVASSLIVLWRFRKIAKPGEEDVSVISDADLK